MANQMRLAAFPLPEPMVMTLSPVGEITAVNGVFEQATGLAAADIRNRRPWELLPLPGQAEQAKAAFAMMLNGDPNAHATHNLICGDGDVRRITWTATPLHDAAGRLQCVVAVAPSATCTQCRAADQLRVHRAVTLVSQMETAISRAPDAMDLMQEACEMLAATPGFRLAWIGRAEDDMTVRPVACAGYNEGYLDQANVTWDDSPSGKGPVGSAIRTRRAVVINHTHTDPSFSPWRDAAVRRGYASVLAVPLFDNAHHVMGAMAIYSEEPAAFGDSECACFAVLGDRLSSAIHAMYQGVLGQVA